MKRCALLVALAACAAAGEDNRIVPLADPPAEVAGLPRVLLIGDSISIGYTPAVRELLRGKANVYRIATNGGPTINGLANLDSWLGRRKWDVLHANWGLHDLKIGRAGERQVSLEQYERNLRILAPRLKSGAAHVIFANTTPVPEGKLSPARLNSDVIAYNEAAARVMRENGIEVNDLYSLVLPRLKDLQLPENVHFTPAGYRVLADQVAARISAALAR
jgi:acyl-CoA thioesterase-1